MIPSLSLVRRPATALAGVVLVLLLTTAAVRAEDPALEKWITQERQVAQERLRLNLSPSDGMRGVVLASPSRHEPDYYYHWTRDGALTMAVVVGLWKPGEVQRGLLRDYAGFSRQNQMLEAYPNSQASFGLGEPKFHVTGPVFEDSWGRPQNDGPALRALTLIQFARQLLDAGDAPSAQYVRTVLYDSKLPTGSVIKADLEYVAQKWPNKDVDLWEEIRGYHFFTRLAQHRALVEGAALAERLEDPGAATYYRNQAQAMGPEVEKHWNAERGQILATREVQGYDFKPSQLDASVVIAALRTRSSNEPLFSPVDDRILATA